MRRRWHYSPACDHGALSRAPKSAALAEIHGRGLPIVAALVIDELSQQQQHHVLPIAEIDDDDESRAVEAARADPAIGQAAAVGRIFAHDVAGLSGQRRIRATLFVASRRGGRSQRESENGEKSGDPRHRRFTACSYGVGPEAGRSAKLCLIPWRPAMLRQSPASAKDAERAPHPPLAISAFNSTKAACR